MAKRDQAFITAFGKKVAELRKKQGMSQYTLAYESDIARSQIVRIENGQVNTSISSISALANTLNVEPIELLDFGQ